MLPLPRSVLVFRSAALGDFILGCPALRMLRHTFPGAQLVMLTTQSASKGQRAKVAQYAGNTSRIPWVDLARPHLLDDVVVMDGLESTKDITTVRQALSEYRFDLVVLLLEPAAPWLGRLKKLLLMFLLVGWVPVLGWRGRGLLHRSKAALHGRGLLCHHVEGAMQFLAELPQPAAFTAADVSFDLRPDVVAQSWAEGFLREPGLLGKTVVALAPGSIQPHKRWPLARFKQLCGDLLQYDATIVLLIVGTPADASVGDELLRVDPERIINLAGKTSIAQSAALFRGCALVVGNDGGAMHLGDAMGTKVVSIVPGLEYPNSIEPWNNRHLAIRHPVECAPCYHFTHCPQGHNKCMTELPVDRVLEKCIEALSNSTPVSGAP